MSRAYYTAWLNSATLCVWIPGRPNNPVVGNIVGNGNIRILSGSNVQIPVQVPVDICGNAVGLLGFANASCQGGAAAFLDSFNG